MIWQCEAAIVSQAFFLRMQPPYCLATMQMFYDDLPIWGFIGKVEKILRAGERPDLKLFLFTHIHFEVMYKGNRVVEINISANPDSTVDITEGENIIVDFTYSVKWKETNTPYERRMDKYSKYSFLPQHLEVGPVVMATQPGGNGILMSADKLAPHAK